MTKIKVTLVQVKEFEFDPSFYDEGTTLEQAMEWEEESAKENYDYMMDAEIQSVTVEAIHD